MARDFVACSIAVYDLERVLVLGLVLWLLSIGSVGFLVQKARPPCVSSVSLGQQWCRGPAWWRLVSYAAATGRSCTSVRRALTVVLMPVRIFCPPQASDLMRGARAVKRQQQLQRAGYRSM